MKQENILDTMTDSQSCVDWLIGGLQHWGVSQLPAISSEFLQMSKEEFLVLLADGLLG